MTMSTIPLSTYYNCSAAGIRTRVAGREESVGVSLLSPEQKGAFKLAVFARS